MTASLRKNDAGDVEVSYTKAMAQVTIEYVDHLGVAQSFSKTFKPSSFMAMTQEERIAYVKAEVDRRREEGWKAELEAALNALGDVDFDEEAP